MRSSGFCPKRLEGAGVKGGKMAKDTGMGDGEGIKGNTLEFLPQGGQ